MTLFTSTELDALAGFARTGAPGETQFSAVSTDTRTLPAGALFVPLSGPNFDGHAFLGTAAERGAAGALVSRDDAAMPGKPLWRVADTLVALGDLARKHRDRFALPLLGLTGTSGKTTTKEILRSIFATRRLLVNAGNLNNLIGVPQTLFGLRAEHEFAVIEMGMNQFGEIGRLAQIARPTVGLINNVGPGHLAGVGDLEGVLRAKTEIAREMPPELPVVLNADDALLRRWGQGAQRKVIWFGLQAGSDVTAADVADHALEGSEFTLKAAGREARVRLRLPGEHNVRNALGAAAAALQMGLPFEDVAAGLSAVEAFRMRSEIVAGPNGATIINDCYNANPASMREGLRVLAGCRPTGRIAAVLGDMLELGDQAAAYHAELGAWLGKLAPDRAWIVGEYATTVADAAGRSEVSAVADRGALEAEVRAWLAPGDTLLVKASRGVRLEQLVESLTGKKSGH